MAVAENDLFVHAAQPVDLGLQSGMVGREISLAALVDL